MCCNNSQVFIQSTQDFINDKISYTYISDAEANHREQTFLLE